MLMIIGLQFFVFGLLGEVLARTYYESQDKKIYSVRQVIANGGTPPDSSEEGGSVLDFPARGTSSSRRMSA